jgi:shikimate kinase
MKNIVLIGMPGSGKTTVGILLSKKLNMKFVDMDEYIESVENKSIIEMFEISEEYFRNAESKCAKILSRESSLIIAAGGGIIKRKENIIYLKQNSIIIFLNRPPEKIMEDININTRPLLMEGKNKLYKLYQERLHLYKKYCDLEVLNDKTLDDAANEIKTVILKAQPSE